MNTVHTMKTIEVIGHVDERHRLSAQVPPWVVPGPVKVALVVPSDATCEEDDAGREWAAGIAREWVDDLADPQQDIYTLEDGEPVTGTR